MRNARRAAKEIPAVQRLSQANLPSRNLKECLRIPQALVDNFAGSATAPFQLASAMELSLGSSVFRDLAAASAGYGLTKGSRDADKIELTDLGRRAIGEGVSGGSDSARVEAALRPTVLGGFFRKYHNAKFPPDAAAKAVLQSDFGVPKDRTDFALQVIKENGALVNLIKETKTGPWVYLDPGSSPTAPRKTIEIRDGVATDAPQTAEEAPEGAAHLLRVAEIEDSPRDEVSEPVPLRVFIAHGKNTAIVEQVKDILGIYDIDFEVVVEEETAAIPVPTKVMRAMRRCNASIMVVSADEASKGGDQYQINTNVLIEIGAAFVLYDEAVVLVWDKRLPVPSNLQGLVRLEYEGNELSFAVGTKLAKSIKSLRTPESA